MLLGHLYVFFGKMSIQAFCSFFKRVVCFFEIELYELFIYFGCCMSCLYILDVNPLSVTSFANIFSHSVGCIFVLSVVFFAVQKLLSLIRSYCLYLLLFLLPWETDPKKYRYNLCQKVFCLCSLLGVLWFQVLHFSL